MVSSEAASFQHPFALNALSYWEDMWHASKKSNTSQWGFCGDIHSHSYAADWSERERGILSAQQKASSHGTDWRERCGTPKISIDEDARLLAAVRRESARFYSDRADTQWFLCPRGYLGWWSLLAAPDGRELRAGRLAWMREIAFAPRHDTTSRQTQVSV